MGNNKIMKNNAHGNLVLSGQQNQLVRTVLLELSRSSTDVEASAVVTTEGVTIASLLTEGIDTGQVGVMCASLLALAETASLEFKRGKLKQLMIDAECGYVLIVHVGETAALVLVTQTRDNVGMVFLEAYKTAQNISKILA